MKILRVASDMYPYVVGGLGIHVSQLSRLQAILGHDVTVYINKNGDNRDNFLVNDKSNNYKIISFKPLIKIMGNSITPKMFFQLMKDKNNYDIVHAHSHLFFSTNLCALTRKIGKSPPLVVTDHGLKSQTVSELIQNIYTKTITKLTLNAADKVICYTEIEKEELTNIGIKSQKIEVIHNGIDTRLFIPNNRKLNNNRLLWVGRFVKGKGIDYLIDAFKLLKNKYSNIHMTMIGNGPDKEVIERRISMLEIDKNIRIIDFIPNSDIVRFYQCSDVFVLPSIEEGVPRTILEAMSCSIPIVCSRLPHLVDIVKNSGLLVPIRDSQALADNISVILSDKDLAIRLGNNGRKNVINNYSWEDTVKRTIKLYETLI